MRNFSKLIFAVLAIVYCNSINATEQVINYSIIDNNTNSIISTNTMNIDTFVRSAENTTFNIIYDLSSNIGFNILIKSFINNNTQIIGGNISNIDDKIAKKCNDDIISSLSDININVSDMNINSDYNYNDKSKLIHFHLSADILKNALKQNNVQEVSKIMVDLNKQFSNVKYGMYGNLYAIKNMSQDNKDKLNSLITTISKTVQYMFINGEINWLNEKYQKLSNMKFADQSFDLIRCSILEMINNKLEFLKAEKECLQELGIDPATLGE